MPLGELLSYGAEPIATGVVGQLPWRVDSQGRSIRATMTQAHVDTVVARLQHRMGRRLSGAERGEVRRIAEAADNASRQAHKLDRDSATQGVGMRLPRPAEITRLPGTGNRGGDTYTYTVVISYTDARTGQSATTTHVVTDPRVVHGDVIRAETMAAIARGDIVPRQGSGEVAVAGLLVTGIDIISVYRGALHAR